MTELLLHILQIIYNTKVELSWSRCWSESLLSDNTEISGALVNNLRAERFRTFMRPLKGSLQQLQPAVFTHNLLLKEQDSPFYSSLRRWFTI